MRVLLALLVLSPAAALAADEPAEQNVSAERPYWDNCRNIYGRHAYSSIRVDVPLFAPGSFSGSSSASSTGSSGGGTSGATSGSGSSFSGGSGHPEALLVLAVIAIAALPFIIYAVDSDADGLTRERFFCPEFSFSAMGGVQAATNAGESAVGIGIAKVRAQVGYVGAMAEVNIAPARQPVGAFSAHFLLRVVPKAHIEGALALGGRRQMGPGGLLDGFEVALPHMYVFSRNGYRAFGLELMPRVFWNKRGIDAGADLNLVVPLADILQLRVGVAAFSHASQTQLSAAAGLTVHL